MGKKLILVLLTTLSLGVLAAGALAQERIQEHLDNPQQHPVGSSPANGQLQQESNILACAATDIYDQEIGTCVSSQQSN